jgi:DNA-binding transcriptional LysR family regulator
VRFGAEYSDIRLSLSAQGHQVSLSRREADVAVRLVRPNEASSVTRKVGRLTFGLYAHRSYGQSTSPERWQFMAFDQSFADVPQQSWLIGIAGNRPVACELNHISEHLIAVRAKVGVAGLPCFLAEPAADLVRISVGVPELERDIWLVVHPDLRKTAAVRAVIDFVIAVISAHQDLSTRK